MRTSSALLLCFLVLSAANLHARMWKSVNGETLEAEFVRADRMTVTLKAGQKPPETCMLSGFCRADQIYVQQQSALRLGKPPEQLVTSAKVTWDFIESYTPERQTSPILKVELAAQGASIANAGQMGDLQIETFETDAPTPLKLSDGTSGLNGKLTYVDKRPLVALPHGMYYLLQFTPNDEPVTHIRRLKGSYKIVTGDPHTIIVKKINHAQDVEISDPFVKQLRLRMFVNASEPSFEMNFGQGSRSFTLGSRGLPGKLLDVSWTDPAGYRYCGFNESSSHWQNDAVQDDDDEYRGSEGFNFTLAPPVPRDLELRITVLTNPREERVHFDFTDLEVPARPKSPPPRPSLFPTLQSTDESAAIQPSNASARSN